MWLGALRSVSLPLTPPGCWMCYTWIFGAGEVGQEVGGSAEGGGEELREGLVSLRCPAALGSVLTPAALWILPFLQPRNSSHQPIQLFHLLQWKGRQQAQFSSLNTS